MLALDSASRLNASADKAAGYVAHGRYLTDRYQMDAQEVASATAVGLAIWSLFEEGPEAALLFSDLVRKLLFRAVLALGI